MLSIPHRVSIGTLDDKFASIKSNEIDFFGVMSKSPDGRFLAICAQEWKALKLPINYALVEDDKVVAAGKVRRPHRCRVANNGTFIIEDWSLPTKSGSTMHALDSSGSLLLKRSFRSNSRSCDISADGHYAAFETGSRLYFFNLIERRLVWSTEYYPFGHIEKYDINTDARVIHVKRNEWQAVISFSGKEL